LARLRAQVVPPLRRVLRFWGRHRAWAAIVLLLVVLLAGAVVDLLRIRSDLDRGRQAISGLQIDNLDAGLVPTITQADDRLNHADRIADHSPFLAVLGVVPGLRDQVHGVRDMTEVAADLGRTGVGSARAIDKVLKQAGGDASKRVTLLDTVLQQLDVVQGVVGKVHVGAHERLLSPLAGARRKLVSELDAAPARLDEARFYVTGLRRLLVGPSRYLLLASNNAEMRGGAGSPLSGGVVTIQNGDIEFGEFKQLVGIRIPRPAEVFAPASWTDTYNSWVWGQSYLETSASPNFSVTGPIYQAMAPAAGFGAVDGVLDVDAVALRNLLSVVGPVELEGVKYDEHNVEQELLNENYLRFADAFTDRGGRVELQSALAKAIFEAFKARDVPIVKLALALREAATGRHLIAHSTDPAVQTLWESIGADGALNPFGLMVAVENVAANKLDWYIDPKVTLTVLRSSDDNWTARLIVEVPNPKVDKTSQQIDGGYYGLQPGEHRAMVAAYLPRAAYNIHTPDNKYSELGPDPPLHMVAQRIDIPRGESRQVTFEFSLPKDWNAAVILPSGRVRPVTYEVNGVTVTDAAPATVLWQQPAGPDNGPGPVGVAAVLALAGALAILVGVRSQLRLATVRPMRAVPDLVQRAPAFGFVLFLAAFGVLVAGVLINGAT
jgi:hypothetical protein